MQRNKTWSTYPWWLLLVGFAFGVLVTLWATRGNVQTVTVYREAGAPDQIWLQATQMVHEATLNAANMQAAMSAHATASANTALDPLLMQATAMSDHATANAFIRQVEQPGAADPVFMTATAIVMEATAVAGQAQR